MKSHKVLILAALLIAASCTERPQPVILEFRIAETEPSEGLTPMVFSGWGQSDTFYVHGEVLLSAEDVADASVTMQDEFPIVALKLTEGGTIKFAEITGANVGRHLGIIVDGRLLSAPVIRDTILFGRAQITGDFSEQEAERLADALSR